MLALRFEFGWRFSRFQAPPGFDFWGFVDVATGVATLAQAPPRTMAAKLAAVHPRCQGRAVITDARAGPVVCGGKRILQDRLLIEITATVSTRSVVSRRSRSSAAPFTSVEGLLFLGSALS